MNTLLSDLRIRMGQLRQDISEYFIWRRHGRPLSAGLLLEAPPVVYLIHNTVSWRWQLLALSRRFSDPGLLLVGHYWLQNKAMVSEMENVQRYMQEHLPRWTLVSLCNSPLERELYRNSSVRAELINQNAFLDEQIFEIHPDVRKDFDALYDAQLIFFKRHALAAQIPRLALISYKYGMNFDQRYGRETVRQLAQATWLNNPMAATYRSLLPAEVAHHLNRAHVGLALSEEEGAMYASTQYLLCGLPVVSTDSRGGRDVMFNQQDCLVVDATPEAVASGVQTMIARNLDPNEIRARVLGKMTEHRERFIGLVQAWLDRQTRPTDFRRELHLRFTNKLIASQPIGDLAPFPVNPTRDTAGVV